MTVLVEGETGDNDSHCYYGRTSFQAPDVDGMIYLKPKEKGDILLPGDVVQAIVTATDVYDLMGEIL